MLLVIAFISVQYILPKPDPAAYSDPRMTNLIEYARKVENAMYTTAKDKEEYFHLLSERCYKIYKELEEVRRRRRTAANGSSGDPTTTSAIPSDSGAPTNRAITSSSSAFPNHSVDSQGPASYRLSLSNNAVDALVDVKPEGFPKVPSTYTTDDDGGHGNDMRSNQFNSSDARADVKRNSVSHESNAPTADNLPLDSQAAGGNIGSPSGSSTDAIKVDDTKWKKWSREELLRHFLPLHADVYNDVNAPVFRDPVDFDALGIPDYPEIITHPMDLTTIRNNLEDGVYKEPWDVLDHFRLIFNNAWRYNRKTSKVYKMCTKVCLTFERHSCLVIRSV